MLSDETTPTADVITRVSEGLSSSLVPEESGKEIGSHSKESFFPEKRNTTECGKTFGTWLVSVSHHQK